MVRSVSTDTPVDADCMENYIPLQDDLRVSLINRVKKVAANDASLINGV